VLVAVAEGVALAVGVRVGVRVGVDVCVLSGVGVGVEELRINCPAIEFQESSSKMPEKTIVND